MRRASREAGAAELAGLAVLVADDNEANRAMLASMLEGLGCRCDSVADGAAAIEQASAHAYDAVLVDVDLPVLNGAQCLQAIGGLPAPYGSAAVIALVPGSAGAARIERHRQDGFAAVLTRPVGRPALIAALARGARGRAADAAAIDMEHLGRYTMGDAGLEAELFGAFLPNAAGYIDAMAAADDAETFSRTAHALKGAARGMGAFGLGELAAKAEAEVPAGPARARLLEQMRAALADVRAFIERRR